MDTPPGPPPYSPHKSGPKPPAATDEQVYDWLREHPKGTAAELARAFGFTATTAKRTWHRVRKQLLEHKSNDPRARTPAANLPEQDRETVLKTVRHAKATLLRLARRLDVEVEQAEAENRPARLDRDTTQAMLSLQRATQGLIEMHPGLLDLAREAEDEKATDDDLDGILAALGLNADAGPPSGGAVD